MAALTRERLKELLCYESQTGRFTWLVRTSNRIKVGNVAGCVNAYGYLVIGVDGVLYQASRLAWFYAYGYWPVEVDHRDGDPSNNRIDNLRECEHTQNQKNMRRPKHNTSGFKGVHKCNGRWRARICADGKHVSLGVYDNTEEAAAAYDCAAVELHGEFAKPNR